jgi:hypothetical protein
VNSTISTWDFLVSLGFVEDADVLSDWKPGLSYSFGRGKLTAVHVLNRHFQKVVELGGIMTTRRTHGMIHNEMAVELESPEQGMAWLSWTLDHAADGKFRPALEPAWLEIGRQNQHLLPWNRELAAFAARPLCLVPREWLRLGLRELAEQITNVANDAPVIFSFDGSVLQIGCNGKIIPMPAEGKSWEHAYSIPSAKLNSLPKRLMRELIEVSFYDSSIRIANWCYSGAEVTDEIETTGSSSAERDERVGGSAGESGGTLAAEAGEPSSGGNTEEVSGSDIGSLSAQTDGTAKPEPDGTGVPPEGVNNKAIAATAKMVRASNNTQMPDSTRQALRNYVSEVKKRAYMQSRNAKAAESAAPVGLSPEQMRASSRLVKAALDHGVSKFDEFVAFVADRLTANVAIQAAEGIELAWNTLRRLPEYSDLDPAGKVADVLGTETGVTDEKRPERNESTGDGGRETAGRPVGEGAMEEASSDSVSADEGRGDAGSSRDPSGGRSGTQTLGIAQHEDAGTGGVSSSDAGHDRPSGRSGRLKDAFFKTWWPMPGQEKELAFEPKGDITAVPIYPHETRMTWDEYLDRMRTRLRWMRETSDLLNPNQWYRRQWWAKSGVDVAIRNLEDHVYNPDFQEMLQNNGVEPEMFPLHPKPTPRAVDSIQELDLTGWLELALPSREWD